MGLNEILIFGGGGIWLLGIVFSFIAFLRRLRSGNLFGPVAGIDRWLVNAGFWVSIVGVLIVITGVFLS